MTANIRFKNCERLFGGMDAVELERLGLNKNEAKVYFALLNKGEACASELVKALGVHRNIVYDNLEKLIEKGLVSFVNVGAKRRFMAAKPSAIVDFLEEKKKLVETEICYAKELIPQIGQILGAGATRQDVSLFRGIGGLKKVLGEIVSARESWCIGITNKSTRILGETYWKNYNLKKKVTRTKEWLLWNSDFVNTVIGENPRSKHRRLPKTLDQITETIMYDNKAAIFVYSADPIVIVIENKSIFEAWKAHFEFLWAQSKEINRKS